MLDVERLAGVSSFEENTRMKKSFISFYLAALITFFAVLSTLSAHIGYTGRNLGTWSQNGGVWSVAGNSGTITAGSVGISVINIASDFGWADATDADYGDSHKGRWFSFTLNNPGTFSLSVLGGGTNSSTSAGLMPYDSTLGPRFLPGFTIYRGLAPSAAHDSSVASITWRTTRGSGSEGSLNTLGNFSIANDAGDLGELVYVGHAVDGTSANYGSAPNVQGDGTADGFVSANFGLSAGSYSVFVGGANYSGVDIGNYGAGVTFGAVPEPSIHWVICVTVALFILLNMWRKKI